MKRRRRLNGISRDSFDDLSITAKLPRVGIDPSNIPLTNAMEIKDNTMAYTMLLSEFNSYIERYEQAEEKRIALENELQKLKRLSKKQLRL